MLSDRKDAVRQRQPEKDEGDHMEPVDRLHRDGFYRRAAPIRKSWRLHVRFRRMEADEKPPQDGLRRRIDVDVPPDLYDWLALEAKKRDLPVATYARTLWRQVKSQADRRETPA